MVRPAPVRRTGRADPPRCRDDDQGRHSRCSVPSANCVRGCSLFFDRGHGHHPAVIFLAAQPSGEGPHQQRAIQPVRPGTAMIPLGRDAKRPCARNPIGRSSLTIPAHLGNPHLTGGGWRQEDCGLARFRRRFKCRHPRAIAMTGTNPERPTGRASTAVRFCGQANTKRSVLSIACGKGSRLHALILCVAVQFEMEIGKQFPQEGETIGIVPQKVAHRVLVGLST